MQGTIPQGTISTTKIIYLIYTKQVKWLTYTIKLNLNWCIQHNLFVVKHEKLRKISSTLILIVFVVPVDAAQHLCSQS